MSFHYRYYKICAGVLLLAQISALSVQAAGLPGERPRLGLMHKIMTAATIAYLSLAGAEGADARGPLEKVYAFGTEQAARLKADAKTFTDNPFAASIWGGIHTELRNIPRPTTLYLHDQAMSNPKGLPLETWIAPSGAFGEKKRPIVFILPGTFSTGLSGTTVAVAEIFIRKGYHVISVPSPLSLEYIKAGISTQPLDIPAEADFALRMIRSALNAVGSDRISSVHLVGLSYGGFLTGVVAAKDSQSKHPIFTTSESSITMISPPLHFGKAIEALDGYLDDTQASWEVNYADSTPVKAGLNILFSHRPSQLDPRVLVDSKAIFAHAGFKIPGAKSVAIYATLRGIPNVFPTDPVEKAKWQSTLRLRPALSKISPRGTAFLDDARRSDLGFWLDQLHSNTRATIQIEASTDDPLNRASDWTQNRFFNLAQHAALSPHGGHFGAVPTPEFRALLSSGVPSGPVPRAPDLRSTHP